MQTWRTATWLTLCVSGLVGACTPVLREQGPLAPTTVSGAAMSQLWTEPTDLESRDLMFGSGGRDGMPRPNASYTVVRPDNTGYSPGYDVVDAQGRAWDIKVGKEAQPEVAVSRILWALGYHQPAIYYVTDWQLAGTWELEGQPARFRLEADHDNEGEWEWRQNPFSGSRALHGLIAVNVLFNNWDFKTSNNRIYQMKDLQAETARRFVVQDLGASLGKSKFFPSGSRNDIDDFEQVRLVKEATDSRVVLDHSSRHRGIIELVTIADVVWACALVNRLSDAQLDDAFEAAGYEPAIRARFIAKIRSKIQEGLALRGDQVAANGAAQ